MAGTATVDRAVAESESYPLDALPDDHPGSGGGGSGLHQGTCAACGIVGTGGAVHGCPGPYRREARGKTVRAGGPVPADDRRFWRAEINLRRLFHEGDPGVRGSASRGRETGPGRPRRRKSRHGRRSARASRRRSRIKSASCEGNKATAGWNRPSRDLEHKKPEPPRVPTLLRMDDNAGEPGLGAREGMAFRRGGIERGRDCVWRAWHGQGSASCGTWHCSIMLWDGGQLCIGRRSTESFTVRGARLTVALQVQETTLRSFFDQSGGWRVAPAFLPGSLSHGRNRRKVFAPSPRRPKSWPAPGGIPSAHCRDSREPRFRWMMTGCCPRPC